AVEFGLRRPHGLCARALGHPVDEGLSLLEYRGRDGRGGLTIEAAHVDFDNLGFAVELDDDHAPIEAEQGLVAGSWRQPVEQVRPKARIRLPQAEPLFQ